MLLTTMKILTIISLALNKISAQKQKQLSETTASRRPLFHPRSFYKNTILKSKNIVPAIKTGTFNISFIDRKRSIC